MKIKITFIPSNYQVDEWYHFTDRSLQDAIKTKKSGVKHKFTMPTWESIEE